MSHKDGLTSPLHTDRIKLIGESERLLAAGKRGRWFDVPEVLMQSPVVASLGFWLQCAEEVCYVSPH